MAPSPELKRLLCAAALVACLLLAGCAESNAKATVPDRLTVTQAAPSDLVRNARKVLARLPADTRLTHYGVALSTSAPDDTWYLRVLARDRALVLQQSSCDRNWQGPDWWRQAVQPGDAIAWKTAGWDDEICPNELSVVEAGAAL